MYKQQSILALIPARGGSKGIPKKNIKSLGGKPLLVWTIETAKQCPYIDRLILSSDDDDIIQVAKNAGCEVPFIRPAKLALNKTPTMDVIVHAINSLNRHYDYVLLLQPTSPFRKVKHITGIITQALDTDSEMMISVARLKKHPAYMYSLEEGYLKSFVTTQQRRRQDMPAAYAHNGALYFAKTNYLLSVLSYNVPLAKAYEMDGYSSIDLDEPADWELAEYLLANGKIL